MMAKAERRTRFAQGDFVKVDVGDGVVEAVVVKHFPSGLDVKFADGSEARIKKSMLVETSDRVYVEDVSKKLPSSSVLPSAYQNEHILSRESEASDEAAAYVLSSEWDGQVQRDDPFKEAAQPYIDANPGEHFRYLGPTTMKRKGDRDYKRVVDKRTGKVVTVGGMELSHIPKHVYEERRRLVDAETDREANTRIEKHKEEMEKAVVDSRGGLGIITSDSLRSIRDAGFQTEARNQSRAMFELQD